nr:hypothetical protein [Aeromicrobium sp.]
MSATNRRRATFIGFSGISLAAAGFIAPGAFAAETIDDDVTVSNTETVQVLMNAAGKIDAQRVYEQTVLRGKGKVDVSNPVSTKNLRNLDGFGSFDVRDDKVRIDTSVDGVKKFRSVSDFTKDLPVEVKVTYTLNGKTVEPGDVVGESGDLEVRYEVKNVTGKVQDVTYVDGTGQEKSEPNAVVIPLVGSLTTTLPDTFTRVTSAEANAGGDGRGGTQLNFNMTLFPPIGADRVTFGYKARITDGVVPKASMSVLPVNPLESPSFKGGAASYKGGAESGADLTAGANTIDANLLKIRDGASDLVAGILELKAGADKLSAGLQQDAAPGAKKLADGADQLDAGAKKLAGGTGDLTAGAKKLNAGAGDLSDGLKTAKSGAPALLDGVAKLRAGAVKVDRGLVALDSGVLAGGDKFKATFAGSVDAATAGVAAQIAPSVNGAIDQLNKLVQDSSANALEKGTFQQYATGTKSQLNDGIKGALTGPLAKGLKDGVNGGVDQITGGVTAGVGSPSQADTLRNGMAQLIGGLDQLTDKGGDLVDGIGKLSAGASQLKAGTGDLEDGADQLNAGAGTLKGGTDQLSAGASKLADGLGTAASGSGQLAAGLGTAAESAPALPEGAQKLSDQGSSQLANVGNATA